MQGHGYEDQWCLGGILLARTQETESEVKGQHNHNSSSSQLSLALSVIVLEVNQGLHKWSLVQDT